MVIWRISWTFRSSRYVVALTHPFTLRSVGTASDWLIKIHNGYENFWDKTINPSAKLADGYNHYHEHNIWSFEWVRYWLEMLEPSWYRSGRISLLIKSWWSSHPRRDHLSLLGVPLPVQAEYLVIGEYFMLLLSQAVCLMALRLGDNYSTWESMRQSIQGVLQFQLFQVSYFWPITKLLLSYSPID